MSGDIDLDGLPDLILLLHGGDPACVIDNAHGFGVKHLDTNPRIIAVALGTRDGGYRLVETNHRLIPRRVMANIDDPLDDLTLKHGIVGIHVGLFSSAGSYGVSRDVFRFQWRDNALRLIGYDHMEAMRNTGDANERSINFLTGREKLTTGSLFVGTAKDRTRWSNRTRMPLRRLEDLENAFEFEP